jgi:uncharacterized membrane protein
MTAAVSALTEPRTEPGPNSGLEVPPAVSRFRSLDLIRGAVMVLMALDHVRVYSGVPPGGPTAGVFFTRWITHFCAPAFFFLAGTSAFLHGIKLESRNALSRFLVTRGAWLILLEMTVLRISWTFNLDYGNYMLAGVIWALGWSMIVLALLARLPIRVIAAIAVIIIAGHNLVDLRAAQLGEAARGSSLAWLWQILYFGGAFRIGGDGPRLVVLYSLIPWVGVMAAGYAFGAVLRMRTERRRRVCLAIGLAAIAGFLLLRGVNLYGDPRPWGGGQSNLPPGFAFLSVAKYPASFLFLLMTLGPTIALIPLLERARGRIPDWLAVFGRVPLFFYLLHIPLIHLTALAIAAVRTPDAIPWLFANHPMMMPEPPAGYVWSLPLLYGVTILVVLMLYFPCRSFAALKQERPRRWHAYL